MMEDPIVKLDRPGKYILDDDGTPVEIDDVICWAEWFETSLARRIVAKTTLGRTEVSTVFLALDHQYGEGPLLLYETMVFGGPMDSQQQRYTTRDEALTGHERMCQLVVEDAALVELKKRNGVTQPEASPPSSAPP